MPQHVRQGVGPILRLDNALASSENNEYHTTWARRDCWSPSAMAACSIARAVQMPGRRSLHRSWSTSCCRALAFLPPPVEQGDLWRLSMMPSRAFAMFGRVPRPGCASTVIDFGLNGFRTARGRNWHRRRSAAARKIRWSDSETRGSWIAAPLLETSIAGAPPAVAATVMAASRRRIVC